MAKKLVMDSNGKIQAIASVDVSNVETQVVTPTKLSDLISTTREKTKDVILATRSLKDQHLRLAGLKSKIAKDDKDEDKKDSKKEEKSVNDKVESLDALVEQLEDLIEKLDEKIKADAGVITMDELKDSDSAKEEADEAVKDADAELEDADKELVASFISTKVKSAETLTPEDKTKVNEVIDKSLNIQDKETAKTKLDLATSKEEAKKVLEDAGEKAASIKVNNKEESQMVSKEERIANLKKKLAAIRMKRRLAARFSSKKKAEVELMNADNKVTQEYGASDKNDKANAKKMFDQANKDLPTTTNNVDKKWLTITANRIADNNIAKFKKALEIAGEAQLKDVKVDPIKLAAIKGMVEAGLTQEIAENVAHNAFVEGKQEQVEQLVIAASELTALDNVKFVEAKMKISRYVPTSEQRTASIKQASVQKQTQKISTVVTGSTENKPTDYSALFSADRPTGLIV